MEGFIKLFRKFYEWEWYDNANTMRVYLHLLLKANYKDKNWRGIEIKRGQCVTSAQTLMEELNLSRQQIRTALDNLKSTGEITIKATSRYSLVTIEKYGFYQDKIVDVNQPSNQSGNHSATGGQPQHNKEIKQEDKKEITTTCGEDRIISFYAENIGKPNAIIAEELKGYLDKTCNEAVEYAIKQAVINDRRNCGYIKGILKKMLVAEATTPQKVDEYIKLREATRDTSVVYKKNDGKKQYLENNASYSIEDIFDIY